MGNIVKDVVTRTSGELYLGVVGAVRSGKSTFIRRFLEIKALPYIKDKGTYQKVLDELPQSGEGRNIMTVEPKFVPSDQLKVTVSEDLSFSMRLVDCVGYVIPSASGYLNEDGSVRMVNTPWFSEEIPFNEAANLGTKKVIENHANIGIVMSSDGTFGEFKRHEYELIEEKIISELKELNKPFILVINSSMPNSEECQKLVEELKEKYNCAVISIDVKNMQEEAVDLMLAEVLKEFDITKLELKIPNWIEVLDDDNDYKKDFNSVIAGVTGEYRKLKEVMKIKEKLQEAEMFKSVEIDEIDSSTGKVTVSITCDDSLYQTLLEEMIGEKIENKGAFMKLMQDFKKSKGVYDKFGKSVDALASRGYDISIPKISEMKLEKPEKIKQGSRFGIKLKAKAVATLLTAVTLESTFEPIIGTEAQAEALIEHMLSKSDENIEELWNSEIFGRKLCDVILDGVHSKTNAVTDETILKFKDALEKVFNTGSGGVLAFIL